MTFLTDLLPRLRLPAIAAPMFIVSSPELVIAQCKAGIVGSMPALNARPPELLDEWLGRIGEELATATQADGRPAAPFAVNLIVHRTNARLDHDLDLCIRHKVPIVITSLGARPEVNEALHAYGATVLHDVINPTFARKAIEKGADGLIAVAAGAGGHAGVISPFALLAEIRAWFDGPLVLSGAIGTGRGILAARAAGADLAYLGSVFIATQEANAPDDYKELVVSSGAEDIVYTDYFTGVHGNYLRPTILAAGLDPDRLNRNTAGMDWNSGSSKPKAWSQVRGAGQGIGSVGEVLCAGDLVARLEREYRAAAQGICAGPA